MKKILQVIFIVLCSFQCKADGVLISWGQNNIVGLTKERFDNAKTWTKPEIISHLSTTNEWVDVFLLLIASQQYKTDDGFLEDISTKILDNTVTKLTNTSRLIIWERIITGDILFEGKGYQTSDDLFQVSGRANFLLRNLTGKDFGYVSMKSAKKELKILQYNWTKFLKKEIVAEYIDPYEYSNKALKEIRSKVALQALIYSLKPSAEKEALTKKCLKNVYQLDEMPVDKGSPANFCNPDTYTFGYLATLTSKGKDDETKDYQWWADWWAKNNEKLFWSKEKGVFEVQQ